MVFWTCWSISQSSSSSSTLRKCGGNIIPCFFKNESNESRSGRKFSWRFIRVDDALSFTWATRILSRTKNERFQAWAFSSWAFRNIDEIHTDLLTSAGRSRTRIGRSARLCVLLERSCDFLRWAHLMEYLLKSWTLYGGWRLMLEERGG